MCVQTSRELPSWEDRSVERFCPTGRFTQFIMKMLMLMLVLMLLLSVRAK